ncbi:hypothetical protein ONZ43_g5725 [Nemania bipapillata]|uniref:Uncharacterized protein n=1 Tax=Nemania bipapillata TaxID=110536 RepID=A0ACC2I7A6_9PEZI|nr:hypothetical protein ONZ43_g5725 [Nemania bipapillata]
MPSLKLILNCLASGVTVFGAALPEPTAAIPATACTTGRPMTTAGYPMRYYAQATPSSDDLVNGYKPEPRWASQHLVGSYTFGVPEPVETGFAYAQFKCQYYCQNHSEGGSFFVRADSKVGSYCDCYDELMDPEIFVSNNQTLVGAWNAICKVGTRLN